MSRRPLSSHISDTSRPALLRKAREAVGDPRSRTVGENLLDLLAEAVRAEDARHREWLDGIRTRGISANLTRWLREEAPDLYARIRSAEEEADAGVLMQNAEQVREAMSRWRNRWRVARIGFEYASGLREDEREEAWEV